MRRPCPPPIPERIPTMQTYQFPSEPLCRFDLVTLLDELSGVCDPDFDTITEELERQFQEMRLSYDA